MNIARRTNFDQWGGYNGYVSDIDEGVSRDDTHATLEDKNIRSDFSLVKRLSDESCCARVTQFMIDESRAPGVRDKRCDIIIMIIIRFHLLKSPSVL